MPNFDLVPLDEAVKKSATTGKRARIIAEYLRYIDQLKGGQAGKLRAAEGETIAAVRRRLGQEAKQMGKDLVIRRSGEDLYFWLQQGTRRRGRPRKASGGTA